MVSASYYSELYWKIITAVIVVCYCRVQLQIWELCSLLLLQMQVWWVKYKWIVWCTNVFVIYYSMFLSVLTLHTTEQHLHLASLEQSGLMFNANQSYDYFPTFICNMYVIYNVITTNSVLRFQPTCTPQFLDIRWLVLLICIFLNSLCIVL